jgi:hypothetical protein
MKIIIPGGLEDTNSLFLLENNEKFVIKYMIKKIDIEFPIKTSIKIMNKKNIVSDYNQNKASKRIEVLCPGLLCKKQYFHSSKVKIFTINKKGDANDVLCVRIDPEKKEGTIEKLKKYKKYKKYDILQIGIRIIRSYIKDYTKGYIIKDCIISQDCILYHKNKIELSSPILQKKMEELDILFGFYKEYLQYEKYFEKIQVYYTNETFEERLNRLILYRRYHIYCFICLDPFYNYLYDVVMKNYEIFPEKYNSCLQDPILKRTHPEECIEIIREESIKQIHYYKNNKDIYLEKFYKGINDKVLSESLYFPKYDDISSKIIENELKDIFIEDIKNYIKKGLNDIVEKKEDIIELFEIKNIDKWLISLHKKYKKIKYLQDYKNKQHKRMVLKIFFRYYHLFIELLVIVNTFYEYKQKEVKYDFTKNIERMKYYVFMTRESNYYMDMM